MIGVEPGIASVVILSLVMLIAPTVTLWITRERPPDQHQRPYRESFRGRDGHRRRQTPLASPSRCLQLAPD